MKTLLFGCALLLCGSASAATIDVRAGGSIQQAIDSAAPGDEIRIAAGTFAENLIVDRPVSLRGAGAGRTVVVPAVSAPAPCSDSSLCGGAASSVILVRSSGVTIARLTVDGDNPALAAPVDARNGIIDDHLAGRFDDLHVADVTVQNVYLRGIQSGSGGSGFVFERDTVRGVRGAPQSIGIFNFGGSGSIVRNHVDDANDAIAANWSRGTQFLDNDVTRSGSGVHTDNNGGAGGAGDLLSGNSVADCTAGGYGVWVFVPYQAPTVVDNVVSGCAVGLAAFGGQPAPAVTQFVDNRVTGDGSAGTGGVFVSTDTFGFGTMNVAAAFAGNRVRGFETGVAVAQNDKVATVSLAGYTIEDSAAGVDDDGGTVTLEDACVRRNGTALLVRAGSLAAHASDVVDSGVLAVDNRTTTAVDATGNWWGARSGPAAGALSGPVQVAPVLGHKVACTGR